MHIEMTTSSNKIPFLDHLDIYIKSTELPHKAMHPVTSLVVASRESYLCLSMNVNFMNGFTLLHITARRKYMVPSFKSPGELQFLS